MDIIHISQTLNLAMYTQGNKCSDSPLNNMLYINLLPVVRWCWKTHTYYGLAVA